MDDPRKRPYGRDRGVVGPSGSIRGLVDSEGLRSQSRGSRPPPSTDDRLSGVTSRGRSPGADRRTVGSRVDGAGVEVRLTLRLPDRVPQGTGRCPENLTNQWRTGFSPSS